MMSHYERFSWDAQTRNIFWLHKNSEYLTSFDSRIAHLLAQLKAPQGKSNKMSIFKPDDRHAKVLEKLLTVLQTNLSLFVCSALWS